MHTPLELCRFCVLLVPATTHDHRRPRQISESDHSTIMGMVEQLGLHGTLFPKRHTSACLRCLLVLRCTTPDRFVSAHRVAATGGSDSHGTLKPYAHLGDVWRSRVRAMWGAVSYRIVSC